jgi:hypothetical protein
MKREYDPQLIWAYMVEWTKAQGYKPEFQPHRLQLFVYIHGETGAFYMHGPKLYWKSEPADQSYFSNTDQSGLEDRSGDLKEVILIGFNPRDRQETKMWKTYQDFLTDVGFNKEGKS